MLEEQNIRSNGEISRAPYLNFEDVTTHHHFRHAQVRNSIINGIEIEVLGHEYWTVLFCMTLAIGADHPVSFHFAATEMTSYICTAS